MPAKNNLVGQIFGRLTVIEDSGKRNKHGDVLWTCTCLCGAEKPAVAFNLKSGITRSCGCLQKESRFRHGFNCRGKTSGIYKAWIAMKNRCSNPNTPGFKYWGGKGISVCQEWKNDFLGFMNWALSHGYKPGLWIARFDNDGNYDPKNCRFIERLRHGDSGPRNVSRIYRIWRNIKTRCLNTKSDSYRRYGKKGIELCGDWKNSYTSFKSWALSHGYHKTLCIDRINSRGNYEPSNCQWITLSENSRKAQKERWAIKKKIKI